MAKMLNEIKCVDAFKKFYSDVNQEVFELITLGSKNLLNISKFILDYFKKNGNNYTNDVISKIQKISEVYPMLDNSAQIEVNDKAKNGGYATFEDLYNDIAGREESYTPIEGLTYGKNGLIIILDNEKYCVTCAPTYEAETKNFGFTKWCTASDVCGRYDGYKFFISYTIRPDNLNVEDGFYEKDEYEQIKTFIEQGIAYGDTCVLVQVKNKENGELCQCQINRDGEYSVICNEYDEEYDLDDFQYSIFGEDEEGEDELNSITDIIHQNLHLLKQATMRCIPSEYKKQLKIYEGLVSRAKKENAIVKRNLPQILETLKERDIREFATELSEDYNYDTDEYNWVGKFRFCDSNYQGGEDNEKWYMLKFAIGCDSNRLNSFMDSHGLCVKLYLMSVDGKLVGYMVDGQNDDYDMIVLDKVPYFCKYTRDNNGSDTMLNLYDMEGKLVSSLYRGIFYNFTYLSDTNLRYLNDSSTYICDGENGMKVYFISKEYGNRYIGNFRYVTYNPPRCWGRRENTSEYVKFASIDGREKVISYNAIESSIDSENFNIGLNYNINGNDVASMVREVVERIIGGMLL